MEEQEAASPVLDQVRAAFDEAAAQSVEVMDRLAEAGIVSDVQEADSERGDQLQALMREFVLANQAAGRPVCCPHDPLHNAVAYWMPGAPYVMCGFCMDRWDESAEVTDCGLCKKSLPAGPVVEMVMTIEGDALPCGHASAAIQIFASACMTCGGRENAEVA